MQDIVEGKADHLITKLSFEPGQLNLFQGRQCLHRVTPCQGTKDRMVAVLNYSPFPGMRKSKEVQEMFWGRSSDLWNKFWIKPVWFFTDYSICHFLPNANSPNSSNLSLFGTLVFTFTKKVRGCAYRVILFRAKVDFKMQVFILVCTDMSNFTPKIIVKNIFFYRTIIYNSYI